MLDSSIVDCNEKMSLRFEDGFAPDVNLLGACTVPAHDVIPFNNSRNTHALFAILQPPFDAHNFALGAYKDVGSMSDFARKSKREIQRASRFQIALNYEIQSLGGNIPRLSFLTHDQLLCRKSYAHRQREIITPGEPAFSH
jgi:hypothetical protein